MAFPEIRVSGHGMEITDAISEYVENKLKKHERVFNLATSAEVECSENIAARGVDKDFRVEVTMHLPRAIARVEKEGADIYALVDEASDVLARKVKRYNDKLRQWEGKQSWESEENGDEVEEESEVIAWVPKVSKRTTVDDCMPMSPEEAIERMEMLDKEAFLFKNRKTGIFSMVYRMRSGGYALVEPCE